MINRFTPRAFKSAVESNDKDFVQAYIQHHGKKSELLNAQFSGETALHIASHNGCCEIASMLLDAGAEVDSLNAPCAENPLYYAALFADINMAQILIAHGADVNKKYAQNYTALHFAAHSYPKKSKNFLRHFLMLETFEDNKKVINLLLDHDADINAATLSGLTPLHLAADKGNDEIVDLLLNRGANINAVDNEGHSPLLKTVKSFYGAREATELLIKRGADVNKAAHDGSTALHAAIKAGDSSIVELLLKNGANINKAAKDGTTPLFVAAQKRNVEILKLLLKYGEKPSHSIDNKASSLRIAAIKGHVEAVKLLLKSGVNIDSTTSDSFTALHFAVQHGRKQVVQLLLAEGANVNKAAKDGTTPFFIAAESNRGEIAELLLKKGADVNLARTNKNGSNTTPLQIAVDNGNNVIATLIDNKMACTSNAAKLSGLRTFGLTHSSRTASKQTQTHAQDIAPKTRNIRS